MIEARPENSGEIQVKKDTRFKPGQSGNPAGKPPGTISFKTRIKQILRDNPERFEELCEFYLGNKNHRDLLWKMIDGLPKQTVDATVTMPTPIMGGSSAVPGNDGLQEASTTKEED